MKNKANLAGIKIGLGYPPRIMGVINVSPESFFKGSVQTRISSISKISRKLQDEGADIIDIGAMSTAPYLKTKISETEEAKRLEAGVRAIRRATSIPISIDTSRALPAKAGLIAGAKILNDVMGLRGDAAIPQIAKKAKGLILMANPNGYDQQKFQHPINQTKTLFRRSLSIARKNKIDLSRVVLDPGIGFFRNTKLPWWKWDLKLIQDLSKLGTTGRPLLVGISRKSFIGHLMNGAPPEDRLPGSLSATMVAVQNGASLIRTHDVGATKSALQILRQFSPR